MTKLRGDCFLLIGEVDESLSLYFDAEKITTNSDSLDPIYYIGVIQGFFFFFLCIL
jgi:hypothetical protein